MGDLWIDLNRVFGMKGGSAGLIRDGKVVVTDPESGAHFNVNWNRAGGGFINNYFFNVAVPPGDYRLIEVEVGQ